jgi:Putative beta barrel porin-7 (BBP7)
MTRTPRGHAVALSLVALLISATGLRAQSWPMPSPRPQPNPGAGPAYSFPQTPPVTQAQYGYYYPPPNYYQPSSNANGITYYYVQNPNMPNPYPFAAPYPTPAPRTAAPPSWPAPAAPPPSPFARPVDPAPSDFDDGRKPTVTYHRPTNDLCWFKADYIGSFIKPMQLSIPAATIGSPTDPHPGALGQPGTSVIFGDRINYNLTSGLRLQAGVFLDSCAHWSLDVGGFFNLPNNTSFTVASDANGNPLIARPVFNVLANREGSQLTSFPGAVAGALSIDSKSLMAGVEFNARYHTYWYERFHADTLVGFRYLRLSEQLRIRDQLNPLVPGFLTFLGNNVDPPNTLADEDVSRTVNQFFGPQIGARLSWEYRWLTLEGFTKLAVGATQQQSNINGSTTLITPAGSQTVPGGIFALPTNSGNHNRTMVGLVPEAGLNVSLELTQRVRLNMGYSFLLWSQVVRPGNQFDRNVNNSQVPGSQNFGPFTGPPSPTFRFNDELFWAHSFNLGVEIHY